MRVQLRKDTRTIDFSRNIWTGRMTLSINSKPMEKIKRNVFAFYDDKGKRTEVVVKGNELIGIQLIMTFEEITVLRKLNALEMILSIIPLFLIFVGGAVGGLFGALGAFTNAMLCRNIKNVFLKIVFALCITIIVTAIWLVIAVFIFQTFELFKQ